ncbi:hypothetical protein ACFYOT_19755 [Saccharothrix saharensis]|uniref:hypothetical protein n=1 Tax=Saccharothrix saharensis TaxID=571190 RepID=UPI0036BF1124
MIGLQIVLDSLEVGSRTPLAPSGRVWLELDGKNFPDYGWVDLPLSVVGSMKTAIESIRSGEEGDFYFFEGPYFVKLLPAKVESGAAGARVVCLCDRASLPGEDGGGVVEGEALVPLADVEEVYRRAVRDLLGWATRNDEAEAVSVLSQMSLP